MGRASESFYLHQSKMPKGRSPLLPFLVYPTDKRKTPNKQGLFDFHPCIKTSPEWDEVRGCVMTHPLDIPPHFLPCKMQERSIYDEKMAECASDTLGHWGSAGVLATGALRGVSPNAPAWQWRGFRAPLPASPPPTQGSPARGQHPPRPWRRPR